MTGPPKHQNNMAFYALLVSLVPLATGLSMLGLQYGIGPHALLYSVAQFSGVFALLSVVVGSAFALVAATRTQGRWDHRISLAILLLLVGTAAIFSLRVDL